MERNLIAAGYGAAKKPALPESGRLFIDALWEALVVAGKRKIDLADLLVASGFDSEDGDGDLLLPLCKTLVDLDLVMAYTQLVRAPDDTTTTVSAKGGVVPGSIHPGISSLSDYSTAERAKLGISETDVVLATTTFFLSDKIEAEIRQARQSGSKQRSKDASPVYETPEATTPNQDIPLFNLTTEEVTSAPVPAKTEEAVVATESVPVVAILAAPVATEDSTSQEDSFVPSIPQSAEEVVSNHNTNHNTNDTHEVSEQELSELIGVPTIAPDMHDELIGTARYEAQPAKKRTRKKRTADRQAAELSMAAAESTISKPVVDEASPANTGDVSADAAADHEKTGTTETSEFTESTESSDTNEPARDHSLELLPVAALEPGEAAKPSVEPDLHLDLPLGQASAHVTAAPAAATKDSDDEASAVPPAVVAKAAEAETETETPTTRKSRPRAKRQADEVSSGLRESDLIDPREEALMAAEDDSIPPAKTPTIPTAAPMAQTAPAGPATLSGDSIAAAARQATKGAPSRALLGRSRAPARRTAMYVAGFVICALVIGYAVRRSGDIADKTSRIEAQVESPTKDLRLIKVSDLEALKARLASLQSENIQLQHEKDLAITEAVNKTEQRMQGELKKAEERAQKRGRDDAIGMTASTREKVQLMSVQHAVINGRCDGYGRGNRFDSVSMTNQPVDVLYWTVDPSTLKITGLVATSEQLLKRSDSPITQITCVMGEADIWPSYDTPVLASDGQAKPIDKNGAKQETNPLLR